MTYRLPSHLHRNRHGVLYLRLTVPNDIQHRIGQREIYRSLNTCSVIHAADAAQTLRISFSSIFGKLTTASMSEQNKTRQELLDAFARLPDVRLRLRRAGMELSIAEQQRQIELRESELGVKEAEIDALAKQHERDLDIVIRTASRMTPPPKPTPKIMEVWIQFKAERIAGR